MPTIGAGAIRGVILAAERAGGDVERLLEIEGIGPDALDQTETRIPVATCIALCDAIERELNDEAWLLRSPALRPGDLGLIEYIYRQSPTLGEGYRSLEHYQHIVTSSEAVRVRGPVFDLVYPGIISGTSLERVGVQIWLYILLEVGRHVTGDYFEPLTVDLPIDAPRDGSPYVALIGTTPRYGASSLHLRMPDSVLGLPIRGFDPALADLLRHLGDDVLARLPRKSSLIDLLRRMIIDELPHGVPTVDDVARRVGMSVRSLQRKLSEHDLTFSSLTDQIRHQLARYYLRERDVSVGEAAYLLGFSGPRGFFTAFRRWEGVSPSAFRNGAMAPDRRASRPRRIEPKPSQAEDRP